VGFNPDKGLRLAKDRYGGKVDKVGLAIVDDADSAFIDEARTPLILSATVAGEGRPALAAWALPRAMGLREGVDFRLDVARMRVRLEEHLRATIEQELDGGAGSRAATAAPEGLSPRACLEGLQQALAALHLYRRDQHYVVMDGRVQIVDESTGRVMADRSWERGLHQMIEAKEGLDLSDERRTLSRITYQRFFRRYLRLAGMTGTGLEVAPEIGRVYHLSVSQVPLHRPSRWRDLGARCLPTSAARWQAVVCSIQRHAVEQGRPVLVGTRTVKASEELSAWLSQACIAHVVLNAKQDAVEADVVARAGHRGVVTVATNMAGRGTDIALGEGVAALGGLHVILTEFHDSARIDRQLFGRAARQGDPGSGEAIVSLEDELFCVHAARLTKLLAPLARRTGGLPASALGLLRRVAQSAAESTGRVTRMASLQYDRRLARLLAFSGRGE
jgi:preprotein translocase subunit SecA